MAQPNWATAAGTLGTYTISSVIAIQLIATPVLPAVSITYTLISGGIPNGLTIVNGYISGTPTVTSTGNTSTFTVRATDNLGHIRDRTFSITVANSSNPLPVFTTPQGLLITTDDSTWVSIPIQYTNYTPNDPVRLSLAGGILPPGIEMNDNGIIRGYALPPTINETLPLVITNTTSVNGTNIITCDSTVGFVVGRTVSFSGVSFSGISTIATYYVLSIIDSTHFTISLSANGPIVSLSMGSGLLTTTLAAISYGQPTTQTFSFTLSLSNSSGTTTGAFSIQVRNQNVTAALNTRVPTILNTRPLTYALTDTDPYYGYYIFPDALGDTYDPTQLAFINTYKSGERISFKVIGHDFDGNNLTYNFSGLPAGLTGDSGTGWITGFITFPNPNIVQYTFTVSVTKPGPYTSSTFNFTFYVSNDISTVITWTTPSNLGIEYNNTLCTKKVAALYSSAVPNTTLQYRLISGSLPKNLYLNTNGEISGYISNQPNNIISTAGESTVFTFTVQAYLDAYPLVVSSQTFTLTVYQAFTDPVDTLYITALPSDADRANISNLFSILNTGTITTGNTTVNVNSLIYRFNDPNFGVANNITYQHSYGMYASNITNYVSNAINENHYWRNITLGPLQTAIARDNYGNIVYEVIYSEVIDNLVNAAGTSIGSSITWPTPIPGEPQTLHPNSLYNMRNEVVNIIGQDTSSALLPLWMTSQQLNGSTLGYTKACVICYTLPNQSSTVKSFIENSWVDSNNNAISFNQINFTIDRFAVNKSMTYNYNDSTHTWSSFPGATPPPSPINSDDFYVILPQKTILPNY